nr:hypothetical protein [uncultured Sphaerochaeta sp.]
MMTPTSNYSELIDAYITFKRSLGYAMSNPYHWRDIDRFLQSSKEQETELGITEYQFTTWYQRRSNETARNQYDRACRLRNFSAYYQYQLGLPYPPQLSPNGTPRTCFSDFCYQLENPQNPIRCLIGFGLYEKKGKRIFWTSYLVPFITKSCNGGINFSFMWRMWISFLVPMMARSVDSLWAF